MRMRHTIITLLVIMALSSVCAVCATRFDGIQGTFFTALAVSSNTGGEASTQAVAQLENYLKTSNRPAISEQEFAGVALTLQDAQKAKQLLVNDHVQQIRRTRADEMKSRKLTSGDLQMPFYYTVSGDKPAAGRCLYISMHGGGNAPQQLNDQQWQNQKILYRVPEGVYCAPRAPTNTWNLWHQAHIDDFFDRLIEDMIAFEGIDPNRVYLLGYSAGGDGVYQLAPRMADRFAAASMMSGHPNESQPQGLRNLPFTIQAGGKDNGFDRNKVAAEWGKKLDDLQAADPQGYIHWTQIYADKGHWMDRLDAAALPWMAKYTRNPFPDRVVWRQDDVKHDRFYWLAVDPNQVKAGVEVRATIKGQIIEIEAPELDSIIIRLNDQMLNLDEAVIVKSEGRAVYGGRPKRSVGVIAKTIAERGDPGSVFSSEIVVPLKKTAGQ